MFLLDTDTIIYALNGNPLVLENLRLHMHEPMHISAVTLMELYYGAHKSQHVDTNLAKVKMIENSFQILAPGQEAGELFGRLKAGLESKGQRLDDLDLIVAVTALARNLVLVTNNQKHFKRIEGLKLTNWTL